MCDENGLHSSFTLDNDYLEVFRGLPLAGSDAYQQLVAFYHHHTEASLAAMPTIASELAVIIGFARMLDFFRDNHAAKVHVRKGCKFFSAMQLCANDVACQRIIKIADNDGYLYLPSAGGIYSGIKRAAINLALQSRINRHEVVRFFGITSRHIRNIVNTS